MTLTELFGIELPIVQAPMAGVQDSALAIAVSNAGGLGSLPCAMLAPEDMQRELTAIRSQTTRPFNVNFFCHEDPARDAGREAAWIDALRPYFDELGLDASAVAVNAGARRPFDRDMADVLEPFRPPVVSFHFGLPAPDLLARVKGWGSKIVSSATTVDEARWLEARGVDAIVAQGLEAGGHRGHFLSGDLQAQLGTFALTPQIARAVRLPVIAAGGIADAAGVSAAFSLGAAAAQVGTSYLLCDEATTGPLHRAALARGSAAVTAIANVFTGRPARGIVNRLMRDLGAISPLVPPFPLAAGAVLALRREAERRGRDDFSPMWAGQNLSGCRPVSASVLTRELTATGGR
ncbi:MAG TPA: nitronate monooxygenase [Vicinamibacterales bacterium]|jgi:nitronate monooxygenase|nr:nitronate monooxygenase [Vicinamibacterales bacterium]